MKNNIVWNNDVSSSSDGIFSCILDDSIFNRNSNNRDQLSQETVDQLIVVGLKYKKRCKQLNFDLGKVIS